MKCGGVIGRSPEPLICLISRYICKGNVKENQANRGKSRKPSVSDGNSKLKAEGSQIERSEGLTALNVVNNVKTPKTILVTT